MKDQPKLRAVDGGSITPEEAELLHAFRAMESRGRRNALCAVQALTRVFGRARPTLTLVPTSSQGGAR
jgi:hypothetical protein